jgi:general secretion pathway protein G
MIGTRRCGEARVGDAGFTLLELIVVVALIAVLVAAVSPSIFQRIADDRVTDTQVEARALYEAIVGDPARNQFGFVGDIGRLPNSFQELVERGSLPSYTTNTVREVGMGWRGPYVNIGTSPDDYLTDGFGQPYTGAATGQVRSAGPDGISGNADDIVYPPAPPVVSGTVNVTVKTILKNKTVVDPDGYRVDLYYASNGSQAVLSDTVPPFSFANVPIGLHAVRVVKTSNPGAGDVVAEDTVVVRPGSATALELWF